MDWQKHLIEDNQAAQQALLAVTLDDPVGVDVEHEPGDLQQRGAGS